ncbi:hypothetical protein TrST_g9199 [Triparma strigata]|uniref:Uncharacterized protein n=1 Tax=Triparma strigata TaxID=1606541 RepID=A0A9W7ATM2_9STRA|nr:hypothetical protein TrST_g9199 [Triparma strigata]
MSSEQDRVLSLAAEMGVSRVALQSDDLQKLTDSSSDGLDFESDDDDDTAPVKASQKGSPRKAKGKKEAKNSALPELDKSSSLDTDNSSLGLSGDSLSDSDTVHLSLPGSFDDTLNFESLAVNVGLPQQSRYVPGMFEQQAQGASSQKLLDRISDLEQALTKQKLRHEEEINHLKRRQDETHHKDQTAALGRDRELTLMQQRLSDRKENFRDLAISDSLFQELDALPESQLTLKEFVCVSAHRSVVNYKKDLSESRKKVVQVTDQLQTTMDTADMNLREAVRAKKVAEGREESLRMDLAHSEDRLKELEGKVHEFQRTVVDLREKGRKYDETLTRAKTAEKKYDDLRKLAEDQASALNNAADNEKKVVQKSLDADHQLQLLQMDKSFLQKELELTAQRAERSEKDNLRNEDLLREAMVKRDELLMQLSEERHEGKSLYEQKLEKEINKLREDSAREMSEIRDSNNAVWERENKMLKDNKLDADKQCERAHSDLIELRNAHEALILRHAKINSEQDKEVAEVRNELKMKDFEVAKLSASYEEIKRINTESNLQIDLLRKQLVVHQTEFASLRQEAKSDKEVMLEKLEVKDEQLEVYLQAEIQFEAQIDEGTNPGEIAALSAPKKRVEHAVQLARRVIEVEKARVALFEENERLKGEIDDLRAELETSKKQVEQVHQPTKYVLDGYAEKEAELRELKASNVSLLKELEDLKEEVKMILGRREGLSTAIGMIAELGVGAPPVMPPRPPVGVGGGEDYDDDDEGDISIHLSRQVNTSKAYHSPVKD